MSKSVEPLSESPVRLRQRLRRLYWERNKFKAVSIAVRCGAAGNAFLCCREVRILWPIKKWSRDSMKIHKRVHTLYDLTLEEIAVVEGKR